MVLGLQGISMFFMYFSVIFCVMDLNQILADVLFDYFHSDQSYGI